MNINRIELSILLTLVSVGIVLVIALIPMVIWFDFTIDDSFITFRYSKHFWEFGQPLWNRGGEPVEGYTTTLYMLLGMLPIAFGVDPIVPAKVFGILASMAAILMVIWGVSSFVDRTSGILTGLLIAVSPVTLIHAITGMETALFTAFVSANVVIAWKIIGQNAISGRLSYLLGASWFLAALTRPEGALIGGAIFLVLVVVTRSETKRDLLTKCLLPVIVAGGIFFIARAIYFESLLPNTFYVKSGRGIHQNSIYYVLEFVIYAFPLLLLLGIGLLRSSGQLRKQLVVLSAVSGVMFTLYLFATPIAGLHMRFLAPLYPVLVAGFFLSLKPATKYLKQWRVFAAAGLFVLAIVIPFREYESISDRGSTNSYRFDENTYVQLGTLLRDLAKNIDPKPVLSHYNVGALAYYSDWDVIDVIGLNDRVFARDGFSTTELFARQPDLIILGSASLDQVTFKKLEGLGAYDYDVARSPEIDDYVFAGTISAGVGSFLHVYSASNEEMVRIASQIVD